MSKLTDEKIYDLLGRITPGPWRECGADRGCCTCGQVWSTTADEWVATSEHTGSREVQRYNAEAIALVPDLLAEVARLRGALQTAMGHVDTPISRRRLGIDPNDCEWLSECRDALKPAVVAE